MKITLPKNTANAVSILRIFLTLGLFYFIVTANSWNFFVLGVIAYLTDILDGWIARTFQLQSDLGRNLDTIGDIFFFSTLVIGTMYFYWDFIVANAVLVSILAFCKFFGYIVVLLKLGRLPTAHLRTAQTWGYWLILFVILAFLYTPQVWLLYVMTIHAFIFSVEYILFCFSLTDRTQENLQSYWALRNELQKES